MNFIENIKQNRERILKGLINCIPLPFQRYKKYWLGIQKKQYLLITSNQKVGKSKLSDYLFVYHPFFYALAHPDQIRLKVLYFTFETDVETKMQEFYCQLLYKLDKIHTDVDVLASAEKEHVCPEEIVNLLESERYQKYINAFQDCVTYIETIRNPYGINKYITDFMLSRGTATYKSVTFSNKNGEYTRDVIDSYTPNDPEEYVIVVLDNYANLSTENGISKMETIDRMSKYAIALRDRFGLVFVGIQHQAQAAEGLESRKMDLVEASTDNLADCKTTSRDANMVIGLFNPWKFGKETFEGYDITKLRNYARFIKILEQRRGRGQNLRCPILFDAAVGECTELPRPDDREQLQQVYNYIYRIDNERVSYLNKEPSKYTLLGYIKKLFNNGK